MSGKRAKRRRRERKALRDAVQPKNRPAVTPSASGVAMFADARYERTEQVFDDYDDVTDVGQDEAQAS